MRKIGVAAKKTFELLQEASIWLVNSKIWVNRWINPNIMSKSYFAKWQNCMELNVIKDKENYSLKSIIDLKFIN